MIQIKLKSDHTLNSVFKVQDCLCGLVVRVPGYRSRGPEFDSWRYHIFWEVVVLEHGPLKLVSTIEELHERNRSSSGLEIREYGCGDSLHWPCDTVYPQKLALTSPTSGVRWIIIIRSRAKAMEFLSYYFKCKNLNLGLSVWSLRELVTRTVKFCVWTLNGTAINTSTVTHIISQFCRPLAHVLRSPGI
jgi:hypothetical protein